MRQVSIIVVSNRPIEKVLPALQAVERQVTEHAVERILVYETLDALDGVRRNEGPEGWNLVEVPRRMGLSYNRNQGIRVASGEVIVFIDDDCDPGDEGWLERLIAPVIAGEAHVSLGGVIVRPRSLVGRCVATLGFPAGGSIGFDKVFPVEADDSTRFLSTCNCAMLTEVVTDVGGFDPALTHGGEDTDIGMRISEKGYRMLLVREAVVEHVSRETLRDFVPWQFRRGRAKGQMARRRPTADLVGMRLRSTRAVISSARQQGVILGVLPLLFASYAIQAFGFAYERVVGRGGTKRPDAPEKR